MKGGVINLYCYFAFKQTKPFIIFPGKLRARVSAADLFKMMDSVHFATDFNKLRF